MSKAATILDSLVSEQAQSPEEIVQMFRDKDFDAQKALGQYLKKRGTFFPGKWSRAQVSGSRFGREWETVLDKGDKFKVKFYRMTIYGKVGRLRDPKKTSYKVYTEIYYVNQAGKPQYPSTTIQGASARGEGQASRDKVDKGLEKVKTFAKNRFGLSLSPVDFSS